MIRWAGGVISALPEDEKQQVLQNTLDSALQGKRLKDIAAELNVSAPAIHYQLVRNVPDEWRDVQAARALAELEDAETEIEAAEDMLNLTRAEKKLNHRRWLLERLIPRLYGQKQEVTHTHKVDLETAIQAAERRIRAIADKTIDVTPQQDPE